MATKKQIKAILDELDAQIAPIERKRAIVERARLESWDFDDKNYYAGIEARHEQSIDLLKKAKAIVIKHLVK